MFKQLIIASAISAALFPLANAEQLSPSKQVEQKTPQTKRFIVKLLPNKAKNKQEALNAKTNPLSYQGKSKLKFKRKLASGDYLVEAENFSSLQNTIEDLNLNGQVLAIEEDELVYSHLLPDDHYAASMYSIENSYRGINAIDAWDLSQGEQINITILDTGFTDHPDTRERTINGYDMISYTSLSNDADGRDSDARDPGTGIGCSNKNSGWHGTHVAGIAGASINNQIGAMGIAPKANLVHVRVLGQCATGYRSDIIDGIYWAAGKKVDELPLNPNPAKVINLSLGGASACGSYQAAIDYAIAQGASVVVSAGNNNLDASQQSPANCQGVITVAASDNSGDKASYSNYSPLGEAVDITAPGSSIIAPVNTGTNGPIASGYGYKSGTSMAAPQVAGVIALMLEKQPELTPAEVKSILTETADQFAPYSQCNTEQPICGAGLVNALAAIEKANELKGSPAIVLENAQAISISGQEGEELAYQFSAPSGADTVSISLSAGTGDADLYVKKSGQATVNNYDCRPWLTGNNESCTLSGQGEYSILVRGYNQFAQVNLVASYQEQAPENAIELHNNQAHWDISGSYHEEIVFYADVPTNITGLWVQTWGGSGDADLWVKKSSLPTKEDHDCFASTPGNEETCTLSPAAGRYYIKVRGYDNFNNTALRILWTN
ncbi:S8 family peptidase [Litorilituus sediminis]|uniref:Peptidase S8 n=1 Tax=Litorilituus sediminis TaxID=718192 RepID=A0A4P6P1C5_9GAMM|nr:S8 family peptidase [Litorilituus sediminis]QBG34278.1 hypothetical protein EMK97_00230 [Litorilituus sediminis]